jgi:hypothetical protein
VGCRCFVFAVVFAFAFALAIALAIAIAIAIAIACSLDLVISQRSGGICGCRRLAFAVAVTPGPQQEASSRPKQITVSS